MVKGWVEVGGGGGKLVGGDGGGRGFGVGKR